MQLRRELLSLVSVQLAATIVASGFVLCSALAQQVTDGAISPLDSAPFAQDADIACLRSALEAGNPAIGPSTLILKAPRGCIIPWHWHTAQEQLMVIAGAVNAEMTGHSPTELGPGGFAVMPGPMAHQFTCKGPQDCLMFVSFDAAYDIKWGRGP